MIRSFYERQPRSDRLGRMLYTDHHLYLPDDILVKVDIASMANSLEVRSPFLDYRLVEFAASLPSWMKLRRGESKRILRRAVADILPNGVVSRPKVGFGLPVQKWMRDELYEMASDLLLGPCASSRGLFRRDALEAMMQAHRGGMRQHGYQLWVLLFFEVWCREVVDARPIAGAARDTRPVVAS